MTPSPVAGSDSSSSLSLLRGLQAGSSEAWERLVEIYAPLARSWCRVAGVPAAQTPDLVQDVFLAVHRRIGEFHPKPDSGGFRGWLWTITRNRVRDYYRQAGPQAPGGSTAAALLHGIPEPSLPEEAPTEPNQFSNLLHRTLRFVQNEFQERTWTAFWQTVVAGRDTADVAAELGVSPAAIRQSRSRVLRRLREQLGDLP